MDYIIHKILYNFGLIFSYEWANPYWMLLGLIFICFGLIGVSAYCIDKKRIPKAKAFMVFITVVAEHFFGFLDTLFYVIDKIVTGEFIGWYENWWWHWFSKMDGTWNLQRNIILNIIVGIFLIIGWIYVLRKT